MEAFDVKISLINYHTIRKSIKKSLEKIEYIETKQNKTGGSIVKIPENTSHDEQYKLGLIMKKDKELKSIDVYKYYERLADDFISHLKQPYKDLIIDKYVNNKSISFIERKYYFSARQIYRKINDLIERYIELT